MNRRNNTYCVNRYLCSNLLSKLQTLEVKCDRITAELSEVKNMIESLPPDVGSLIDSINHSAKEMHEQSVMHRRYVEQCVNGEPTMYLFKKTVR